VYQNTDAGQEFTGIAPQLLTDLREPGDIELLMLDRGWGAQEKYDGERRMIRIQDGEVSGINRNGMRVALPMTLVEEAKSLKMANGLIDGEIIGEKYYAFDLLERDGTDLRTKSVLARHQALGEVLAVGKLSGIRGVEMAFTVEAKRALVSKVQGMRGEGIVFKQLTAPYVPGRPASGGNQRKWKFTASATVRVGSIHATKRSVGLECDDESGKAVKLGNCMVPANHQLPKVGDLVEVTYLYLYRGGSLFQPQYGGKRADKTDADTLGSFKLKADNATDDDDATVATESAVAAEAPVKKAKAPKA
jgi:bifunctional non-homologous end joining protein LigD